VRALSLFAVLALAKIVVIAGHAPDLRVWSPAAYLWQDIACALLFAGFERAAVHLGFRRLAWIVYGALVLYAAANIPVGRAVFTPLTWPMLRAARGPLADSLLLYATPTNAILVLSTIAVAMILPRFLRRMPRRLYGIAAAGAIPALILGPFAAARTPTLGMDRNVVGALLRSALPHIKAGAREGVYPAAPFAASPGEDLSWLFGAARSRNIVMVSLESTAAQYLPMYGGDPRVAPRLAALADRAVVFENAYAAYPESIKGLFSILCSTFPSFDSSTASYASLPCASLPELLAGAGYHTALFHSGRFAYLGMNAIVRNRGFRTLEDAGDIGGNRRSSFGVDEPSAVARMLDWIDALPRGGRFFLTYLPIAGHHPYETPARGPFHDSTDLDRYRNAIHYGDASLGQLIDGIRQRGLGGETVWVVFGDHGEAFGQHAGNFGHTFYLYEENVHVPLVIAVPGLPRQVRARKIISLVDVAPTILDLAGLTAPPLYQGRSGLDPSPRLALFFADYSLGLLGLRDQRWKFIYEIDSGREELFDLERDPAERSNLSANEQFRAERYRGIVLNWSGAQKNYLAAMAGRRR